VNALAYSGPGDGNALGTLKVNNVIEGIFGPINAAGMIYALSKIRRGQGVTFFDPTGAGSRRRDPLFGGTTWRPQRSRAASWTSSRR
jgi:hypothetical protein